MVFEYFTFTMGTSTESVQYRVTVYCPSAISPIPGLTPSMRPSFEKFQNLLNKLNIGHIMVDPNPTKTLVKDNESNRIDTQPATVMYRNIHFQARNQSYAVVTVEHGGEFCCFGGYDVKLLKFIKLGLDLSFKTHIMFNIRVTVETKQPKQRNSDWTSLYLVKGLVSSIRLAFEKKINHKTEQIIAKRMISAKNLNKIAKETDMIEHIAAAIERRIAKTTEKEGAHAVTKKIPVVSTVLGAFFAAVRVSQGDWTGAALEMASGVAADLPGAGTLVSLGIDGALLAKDIKEAIEDERKHQQLTQADIERLRQENAHIREELATILSESPIFGGGCHSYFDESELAHLEDIVQIKVRSGDLIDAIQVMYRSQSGKQHGGNGGKLSTFDLGPDEKITLLSGTAVDGGYGISSLSFHTDYGRQKTFGKVNGQEFQFEMTDGSYLGAIKGYDAYSGGRSSYPPWAGNYQLLPAIGFIPKF